MPDHESPPRTSARPGVRRGNRFPPPPGIGDVTRRLAALERQVEDALAAAGHSASALPAFDTAVDQVVGAYGWLRRVLAGEPEAATELADAPLDLLYRWWWRVDVIGLERLPQRGPALVVANRASTLVPYEALMLSRALASPGHGRIARPLLDEWLLRLPVAGRALSALGALPATRAMVGRALDAGEVAIAFPEGPAAVAKPLAQRYRLAPFGRGSLLHLTALTGAPIVPVAVIGAEEVQPVLWRLERLGRLLGLPAVPLTPALVPLPTKWTIHVGEPVDGVTRDTDQRILRARVRERLQGLVSDGVRRRPGLFA